MDEIEALRNDLERLVKEKSIPLSSLEELKEELESEDMKEYLDAIVSRAKPEESLRQNFFYKNAPILRVLGLKGAPEVDIGPGFIDLIVRDSLGRKILIEFKRLFELRKDKLVRNELDYKEYEDQIKKYIFSEAARFVVLTNLYEWHFFSSKTVIKKFKPFYSVNFEDLMSDLEKYGDFYSLLERKEHLIERKELDAKFFESLKEWIKLLSEIEFRVDEKEKNRLILHLLNKLIFIQTLDDYGVIEFNWLYKTWEQYSRYIALAEAHKDNPKVAGRHYKTFLQKFLSEINDFFYPLYDTELFRDDLIEKVKDEPENWKTFYERLAVVLGFKEWQKALGLGLTQYDYSQIDEDILGKAYETYLAEQRKEKGIYYTPKYITQFIVEETLKKKLDELKDEIVKAIKSGNFEKAEERIRELFDIRIIDLASGSGSFLIKALRVLWEAYREIIDAIDEIESGKVKASNIEAFLKRNTPKRLRELLPKDERILMSQIVLRHIFANDLDANALEVAKMNIWRELIRLNPKAFHWAKLGDNEHVLPNLTLNFRAGDSLLGFDNPEVMSEFKEEIKELWKLWEEFLKNPEELTPLERIEEIKAEIRKVLDGRYKQILAEKGLNVEKLAERRFIHYPLEFFMVFFNKDGSVKGGFDFIIGNPPYVRIQNLKKESKEYVDFLNKFYETAHKNYDLALPFIERGYRLLKEKGELGFIVTKKWMKADYGENLGSFWQEKRPLSSSLILETIRYSKEPQPTR
ncbi:MAG: N-6 DNA methylase [Thermococcus sp.]|uniref:Eco57I restriction-modification methylase domain-containing protein n=1 Tax=Thermococcus sp. TaxID=35749 RepID=UPI001D32C444|nr:N-6 DNA methylase [Thermococcus sp.]MBO8174614.1 N-6 DNA methylase [Thermococcus sp.]